MLVGMDRLKPEDDERSTTYSNSGDSDYEQINWLTQMKQFVSKMVTVSNWFPQNTVIYHVTKVVNSWNYSPRLTVIKFGMVNDSNDSNDGNDNNDDSNDSDDDTSQETTNSDWVGISNDVYENDASAKSSGEAENVEEDIRDTGMVMQHLILPRLVPREKRSLLGGGELLGGVVETVGNVVDGVLGTVLGTLGTVTGTVTGGKRSTGSGGTSVDSNVDVRTRHKRSLIFI
ncbi:uncharacterized protein LOC111058087 isoform X6 [Nilaparvata lugens]|nr:uncharacterized protein LOC111058087 isoform X6 [Nilaparvata lugens]